MRKALISVAIPFTILLAAACASDGAGGEGNLSDCGQIDIEASAKCTVEAKGGCTAKCEPLNFTASCSGKCDAQFSASCQADCKVGCTGGCEVDPGKFDCKASCEANCSADCDGTCESDPDSTKCQGSCTATCSGECSASCDVVPPSASCDVQCEASCEGECTVEANIDCSIKCQADLQGGCDIACTKPEGALFCDGQYVDHGGNLESCVTALNAFLTSTVTIDGSAEGVCEGNTCTASAEGSISCSAAPGTPAGGAPWYALVAALGLGLLRRRDS